MKNIIYFIAKIFIILTIFLFFSEKAGVYIEKDLVNTEIKYIPKSYYKTQTAQIVGNNCLVWQNSDGGFPKNVDINELPSSKNKWELIKQQELLRLNKLNKKTNRFKSTIDNGATVTQIIFLAHLYEQNHNKKYKKAVENGLDYLFSLQYDNGGFPQRKAKSGYWQHITYNDNAMYNVLSLMHDIANEKAPFKFLDDKYITKANDSFNKGIDCILKTQLKKNAKLTVWSSQYDRYTLQPCPGRKYELPSINGGKESVNILLLLMSIENPTQEIAQSIEAGIKWFKKKAIYGYKIDFYYENGTKLVHLVKCAEDCPPLWNRFYELESEKPLFSDYDGNKIYSFDKIPLNRRMSYEWYTTDASVLFKEYENWKFKNKKVQDR